MNTMQNNRPNRPNRTGGQHSPSVGDSTLHHICPDDFCVELKRLGAAMEREAAMADFERERLAIVRSGATNE